MGRIAVASLLLYDLTLRATDLRAHYSDAGVLPRAIFSAPDWLFLWSFHSLSGSTAYEAMLFGVAALAGLALLVGYRTRAATLASFVLALSLQGRNPFLRDGQDDLLRVLLFFCLWLPWGRRWSLDARRKPTSESDRVSGLYAVGLFGQIAVMYASSAAGKLQSGWWRAGNGVLRSLQLGRYETWIGQRLTQAPGFLRLSSYAVIALEIALPFLLFVPFRRGLLRRAAIVLATGLHLALWLFMRLGIFPFLCVATWALLVPASWWDRFAPGSRASGSDAGRRSLRPALLALPFLLVATLYVVETHGTRPLFPSWLHRSVEAIGLQQYWIVFSPRNAASMTDGFFVASALLPDGKTVDLFAHDGPVTYERPPLISGTFEDTRWRHFYANLAIEWPRGTRQQHTLIDVREATADWLCGDYASRHPG